MRCERTWYGYPGLFKHQHLLNDVLPSCVKRHPPCPFSVLTSSSAHFPFLSLPCISVLSLRFFIYCATAFPCAFSSYCCYPEAHAAARLWAAFRANLKSWI